MRQFLQRSWVFFVAAAAIIGGTAILSIGTSAAQEQAAGVVTSLPAETMSLGLTSVSQAPQEEAEEDAFELPELLLVYQQYDQMPEARDITSTQAIEIAAKKVTDVFEVDLNGEICHIYFYGGGESVNSRGRWQISFGSEVPGAYFYWLEIDSISAEVLSLSRYLYLKEGVPEEEISQDEYELNLKECTSRAEDLAALFVPGLAISSVEPDLSYSTLWESEYPVYTNYMAYFIVIYFTDGSSLSFDFTPASDQTTMYYVSASSAMNTAVEVPAAEEAPAAEEDIVDNIEQNDDEGLETAAEDGA